MEERRFMKMEGVCGACLGLFGWYGAVGDNRSGVVANVTSK